ncbi:hypothetical protein [Sporisorium scitamineum]|uniref:Uncharacterized protein n=1 Tax=Sporisorium scitamineum TaxID=49012 RepID=A0A0F7S9R8_9BASI|nr:hypothetical protein [Sporisorium scitamineum]
MQESKSTTVHYSKGFKSIYQVAHTNHQNLPLTETQA